MSIQRNLKTNSKRILLFWVTNSMIMILLWLFVDNTEQKVRNRNMKCDVNCLFVSLK
jgi:hypothetical protein